MGFDSLMRFHDFEDLFPETWLNIKSYPLTCFGFYKRNYDIASIT